MKFIKTIFKTNLFKITSLNSFSIVVKIGIGLVTSKLLALFVGPNGMALVGNLRNFIATIESVSTLGFQNGIVKYIAENEQNRIKIQKIITTVFVSLFIVTILSSGILYFFSDYWNFKIFGNHFQYAIIFKILAFVVPFYAFSIVFLAIINGFSQFKKVVYINIIGNIIGLLVSLFLILNYSVFGALLSIIITPSLLFFVTIFFLNKQINLFENLKIRYFDFKIIKNLSSYSLMALISSILGPLVFLAIRKNVIENLGLQSAGFLETLTRISSYYMMFIGTLLSVYFFPKLSTAQNIRETKRVFSLYFKSILPLFILGVTTVYFLRFFIIRILFTKEFLPVTDLFFWQLLGDIFKVASLILGYQFFAKKLTTAFIISEILSFAVLYISSIYFIKTLGIQGVVMAQALDNFLYLVVLTIYFRKILFHKI